ncbi:MAG: F0F1 ATP synthase subunit A [Pseudomonadales bacterium]|nr:F0F1 ATP synthase subunit A [Candidatus Woesebacteria bacterium]MCB9802077.1 F0F1 ATP synthase subunit A [Pseudomonadales bacterium]
MAADVHISLAAEPIAYLGDFPLTNSIFTSLIVSALLIVFAVAVKANFSTTGKPGRLQNVAEWLVESFYNLTQSITGNTTYTAKFLPLVITFFLFIVLNNWLGLLPGVGSITVPEPHRSEVISQAHAATNTAEQLIEGDDDLVITDQNDGQAAAALEEHSEVRVPLFRPGTADLNTTIALSLISMILVQVFGIQSLGLSYFSKFINFKSPVGFFVGMLELISEFSKVISFAFRLFGNIFAGEVLLVVITSLISLVMPMPFYALEIFVGFIQALVFSLLSLVFFNMAVHSHE